MAAGKNDDGENLEMPAAGHLSRSITKLGEGFSRSERAIDHEA
jgi:hypothetical protein